MILGVVLVGLAILIRAHHVLPRGGVTELAQLMAGAFGTGWAFYVSNLAVTVVLGLAANTSFGGLPVLMSILARTTASPTCSTCAPSAPCTGSGSSRWRCSRRCCWSRSTPRPTG